MITYTPTADFNGSDSFTYTVADQQGAISAVATVTITVSGINDLPVAVNDLVNTAEDTAITFSILSNDSDVDASGLVAINTINASTVTIISSTSSGELVIVTSAMAASDSSLTEGQVIYTPNADFNGSDSFTYTVADTLAGVSNTAVATINVTGANDVPVANIDKVQTDEDNALIIDVLANDSDIENGLDVTTVSKVSEPAHGVITIIFEQNPVTLGNDYADNDGIPDVIEGLADSDGDGIPNYLDTVAECNVVPASLASSHDFLLEGAPGVCLRLGELALQDTSGGARISDSAPEDTETTNIGGSLTLLPMVYPLQDRHIRSCCRNCNLFRRMRYIAKRQ